MTKKYNVLIKEIVPNCWHQVSGEPCINSEMEIHTDSLEYAKSRTLHLMSNYYDYQVYLNGKRCYCDLEVM